MKWNFFLQFTEWKKNRDIRAHAECQKYDVHWNCRRAAPSGTNINFLNFCSNCQVVTKKSASLREKKSRISLQYFSLNFQFLRHSHIATRKSNKHQNWHVNRCSKKKYSDSKSFTIEFECKYFEYFFRCSFEQLADPSKCVWWRKKKCLKIEKLRTMPVNKLSNNISFM